MTALQSHPLPQLDWGRRETASAKCFDCGETIQQNKAKTRQRCPDCAARHKREYNRKRKQAALARRSGVTVRWLNIKESRNSKPRPVNPDADRILAEVASTFGVELAVLTCGGKIKTRTIAAAREEAAARIRSLTPRPSYPEIAKLMGFRCHTSALLAIRRHEKSIGVEVQT